LLGIDPDTLRRWADEGRVAAWTTPGGHRRFDRRALERLATDRHHGVGRPLASLGASPERLTRVYRQRYAADAVTAHPLAASLDDDDLEAYRRDGRHLITTLIDYLDADPDDAPLRDRLEAEATAVVDDHAGRLAATGTSLTEAVSLFVAARQPFLGELSAVGRRRSMDPSRLAGLYGDASTLLDRLLLRFIDTHQRAATAASRKG
jgi:excisionase family DNA binding protein